MMSRGRKCHVVDTNVLVVANRRGGESLLCVRNCARALMDIKKHGVIVLDDEDYILEEYRRHCSISGQPGLGDSFIKWVHDNRGRSELVHLVPLPVKPESLEFAHFPEHPDLVEFDPSDKKFVAVANAHKAKPPILQATDTKWWGWKEGLNACGITVEFLCEQVIKALFEGKFAPD